jgi:hypothetical protein
LPLLSRDLRREMGDALRRVKTTFKTDTNNVPANSTAALLAGRSILPRRWF